MVGLDDLKAKIKMFYPKKIVLDTIRGDAFFYIYIYIYISFEFGYKFSSCCYNVFPFFFSDSLPSGCSFYFILSSFFHLHPSCVN